jgi:cytochrome c556
MNETMTENSPSLHESVRAIANKKKTQASKDREQKMSTYAELLRRGKPRDAERLLQLADELGISPKHVALHAHILAESSRYSALAGDRARVESQAAKVEAEMRVIGEKMKALRKQSEPLYERQEALAAEMKTCVANESMYNLFRAKFPALVAERDEFAGQPSAAERRHPFATAQIQQKLRELGLADHDIGLPVSQDD